MSHAFTFLFVVVFVPVHEVNSILEALKSAANNRSKPDKERQQARERLEEVGCKTHAVKTYII